MKINNKIMISSTILMIFALSSFAVFFQGSGTSLKNENQVQSDEYTITLIAKSWNWLVIYPNGTTSNSSMYLYANITYTFNVYVVDNGTDAILDGHGLAIDNDEIIPNLLKETVNTFQYTFSNLGTATLRCSNACGTGGPGQGHSFMKIDIVVLESPIQNTSSQGFTTTEEVTTTISVANITITSTDSTTQTLNQTITTTQTNSTTAIITFTSTQKLSYSSVFLILSFFILISIGLRRRNS